MHDPVAAPPAERVPTPTAAKPIPSITNGSIKVAQLLARNGCTLMPFLASGTNAMPAASADAMSAVRASSPSDAALPIAHPHPYHHHHHHHQPPHLPHLHHHHHHTHHPHHAIAPAAEHGMGMYPDPEAAAAASVLAARSAAFRSPYLAVPIAPSLLSAPSAEEPAPAAAALAASQLEMPATAAGAAGAQVASARRTRHAGQPLTRHLSVSTRRPGHLIPDATGEINSAPAESMNWRRGLPASPALALSGGDPSPMAPAASAPALEEDEIDDGVDGVTDAHAHAAKGAGDYDDSVATGSKRARRSDAADASVTTATIASAAAACKTAARRAARMSMSIDVHARAVGAGEDALPPTGTPRLEPFSASDVVSPAGMGVSLPEGSGDSPVIPSPASDAGSADGGSMRGTSLNDELSPMTPLAGVGGSASSGPVTAGTPSSKGRGRKTKVVYTACKVCNGARGLPLMKDGRGKCSYCNREKSMLAMRERKARERELELSARFEAGVAEGARRAQQQISVLQYRKNLAESDRDRLAADQEVLYENMGELEDLLMLASSAATWAEFKRRAADLDLRSASLETQLHRKAVASRSTMPDVAMDNAATTTTSTAGSSAPSHEATVVHGETLTTPTSTPTSTAGRLSKEGLRRLPFGVSRSLSTSAVVDGQGPAPSRPHVGHAPQAAAATTAHATSPTLPPSASPLPTTAGWTASPLSAHHPESQLSSSAADPMQGRSAGYPSPSGSSFPLMHALPRYHSSPQLMPSSASTAPAAASTSTTTANDVPAVPARRLYLPGQSALSPSFPGGGVGTSVTNSPSTTSMSAPFETNGVGPRSGAAAPASASTLAAAPLPASALTVALHATSPMILPAAASPVAHATDLMGSPAAVPDAGTPAAPAIVRDHGAPTAPATAPAAVAGPRCSDDVRAAGPSAPPAASLKHLADAACLFLSAAQASAAGAAMSSAPAWASPSSDASRVAARASPDPLPSARAAASVLMGAAAAAAVPVTTDAP
ncbi:hypothetical protein CXG81DRAFT_19440 [Caulochytrium protostelioides]|uniref:Uncharacterized protein n=1 Tax=Caulochytrium protostelioides TaxID=1555241 RepID=A0A4P9X647_9FUNG|nr:hypothetical protein CXG81DRAFT_19440 [Caulochytrium protostelioides]|eukprot:RKP00633.1 hypothetical protein CXG81DRAFT_19440 [Caulochytrium protostelioides]